MNVQAYFAEIGPLKEKQERITRLIGILERFDALTFVDVQDDRVVSGAGTTALVTTQPTGAYVFYTISDGQLALLEKSYAQLKESVYGGLVISLRLKPYLDEIELVIDENGIRLELNQYASELLTSSGWEALGKIDAWLNQAEQRADWETICTTFTGTLDTFTTAMTGEDDYRIGINGAENYAGSNGNDTIQARGGDDVLMNDGAGNATTLWMAATATTSQATAQAIIFCRETAGTIAQINKCGDIWNS